MQMGLVCIIVQRMLKYGGSGYNSHGCDEANSSDPVSSALFVDLNSSVHFDPGMLRYDREHLDQDTERSSATRNSHHYNRKHGFVDSFPGLISLHSKTVNRSECHAAIFEKHHANSMQLGQITYRRLLHRRDVHQNAVWFSHIPYVAATW